MKLKLVVVSMSVLGLISSPVLADTMQKHKHHKKHHHHHRHHHDYKAMGGLPVQPAPMAEAAAPVAASSLTTSILDQMTQNVGMAKPMPEWFNRIGISGGINFDTGKWGSRTVANNAFVAAEVIPSDENPNNSFRAGYTGENTYRYSLNPAYLNVTADINEYAKAFATLSYTGASTNYDQAYQTTPDVNNDTLNNQTEALVLEQAFMRVGNFDCYPIFLEVGKQFQDFSRYPSHPITESMTQAISEVLRTSLKVGFINDMGLNGDVYVFQDPLPKYNAVEHSLNYGAAVGFSHPDDQFGYDVGVGYLYNMFGVNNLAAFLASSQLSPVLGWHTRVGGVAAYADINYDAFNVGARFTTVTQHFSTLDIPQALDHLTTGAKPWAAGIQAGYDFNAWNRNQNVYVGYQASHDTVYLNLPHNRFLVGYGIDLFKNTSVTAEWDHDNAWSISDGGPTSGNSNLVSVRGAVKFG